MWRDIALDKLKTKSGKLSFKTQSEINIEQQRKLEEFNHKLSKLNELNIKFHEVSVYETDTTKEEARVDQ
ncbi:hypothetical protein [Exiguobacterium sp. CH10]|uniref:hypothetical protein n=1 Tax=Exiguobacterium sp. CH10 TaxID=2751261 RepID=UPI001BEB2A1F|nr:hypothetical protein [Exiguobacterium sp. CH10]